MPAAPRGRKAQTKSYQKRQSARENLFSNQRVEIQSFNAIITQGFGTLILAGIILAIYLILGFLSTDFLFINEEILQQLGQENNRVLNGEIWRLVTAIFVHANVIHLCGNLLFLLIFGWRLEELKGVIHMVGIFLISALGGNLVTLSLVLTGARNFISIGASGGVEGLFGAALMCLYLDNEYPKGAVTMLSFLIFFTILTIGPQTNFFSHIGGIITGLAIEYFLFKRKF
jgi:rhomboid protease GluP